MTEGPSDKDIILNLLKTGNPEKINAFLDKKLDAALQKSTEKLRNRKASIQPANTFDPPKVKSSFDLPIKPPTFKKPIEHNTPPASKASSENTKTPPPAKPAQSKTFQPKAPVQNNKHYASHLSAPDKQKVTKSIQPTPTPQSNPQPTESWLQKTKKSLFTKTAPPKNKPPEKTPEKLNLEKTDSLEKRYLERQKKLQDIISKHDGDLT